MSLEVGSVVTGKVSGITSFGAFIDLSDNKTGLVHISEVAKEFVKDISAHLQEGQEIKVKIMKIEPDGKVSLSIKRVFEEERRNVPSDAYLFNKKPVSALSFEDKMMRFKSDSDERMQAIKRNVEGKRGGYRKHAGSY